MKMTILTASATILAATATAAPLAPPQAPVAQAPSVADCGDQTVEIYFEDGSTIITPQAQTVLNTKLSEVSVCTVEGVIIEAHTSADGDEISSIDLAAARAESVASALQFGASSAPEIRIVPVGEQYAEYNTGSEKIMNRKAIVHLIMDETPTYRVASIEY